VTFRPDEILYAGRNAGVKKDSGMKRPRDVRGSTYCLTNKPAYGAFVASRENLTFHALQSSS